MQSCRVLRNMAPVLILAVLPGLATAAVWDVTVHDQSTATQFNVTFTNLDATTPYTLHLRTNTSTSASSANKVLDRFTSDDAGKAVRTQLPINFSAASFHGNTADTRKPFQLLLAVNNTVVDTYRLEHGLHLYDIRLDRFTDNTPSQYWSTARDGFIREKNSELIVGRDAGGTQLFTEWMPKETHLLVNLTYLRNQKGHASIDAGSNTIIDFDHTVTTPLLLEFVYNETRDTIIAVNKTRNNTDVIGTVHNPDDRIRYTFRGCCGYANRLVTLHDFFAYHANTPMQFSAHKFPRGYTYTTDTANTWIREVFTAGQGFIPEYHVNEKPYGFFHAIPDSTDFTLVPRYDGDMAEADIPFYHVFYEETTSSTTDHPPTSDKSENTDAAESGQSTPPPTFNRPLILTDADWRNILAAAHLSVPILATETVDEPEEAYINEYNPDRIIILGNISVPDTDAQVKHGLPDQYIPEKKLYVATRNQAIAAAPLAAKKKAALVFAPRQHAENLSHLTPPQIRQRYLTAVKQGGGTVNHLIVADTDAANTAYTGVIAAREQAYPVLVNASTTYPRTDTAIPDKWNTQNNVSRIETAITDAVHQLNQHGLFMEHARYPAEPVYLSLLATPFKLKPDPTDPSLPTTDNVSYYYTDHDYGDINNDETLDLATGRYPDNLSLTSLLYTRSQTRESNKKAVTAAAYLYPDIATLSETGGGLLPAKFVSHTLSDQYDTTTLVERRVNPEQAVEKLFGTATTIKLFDKAKDWLSTSKGVGLSVYIGATFQLLDLGDHALKIFLEHRLHNVLNALDLGKAVSLEDFDPDIQQDEFAAALREAAYPKLTERTLRHKMMDASLIYYQAAGNRTQWTLPDYPDTVTPVFKPVERLFQSYYTGKHAITADEFPDTRARIMYDNADNAGHPRSQLKTAVLEHGAATYIAATTKTYEPFSIDLDPVFFNKKHHTGPALQTALNQFRSTFLTKDIFTDRVPSKVDKLSQLIRNRLLKKKILESRIHYGNPALYKDPEIREGKTVKTWNCNVNQCTTTKTFTAQPRIANNTITVPHATTLTNPGKPRVPVKTLSLTLPNTANNITTRITRNMHHVANVTPRPVPPLSHSGSTFTPVDAAQTVYPTRPTRVNVTHTIDNRTQVTLVHALAQYHHDTTATVYTNVSLTVQYNTPFELDIAAEDTTTRSTTTAVTIRNNLDQAVDATLVLKTVNATHSRVTKEPVTVPPGRIIRPRTLHSLAPGNYSATAYLHVNNQTIGPRATTFTVHNPHRDMEQLRITELLPDPAADYNGNGDTALDDDEYVELHNPSPRPVNLDPLHLQDAAQHTTDLTGFIPAHGYKTVFTPPSLNDDGDTLTLLRNNTVIHTVSYTETRENQSIARVNTSHHRLAPPTPGKPVTPDTSTGTTPPPQNTSPGTEHSETPPQQNATVPPSTPTNTTPGHVPPMQDDPVLRLHGPRTLRFGAMNQISAMLIPATTVESAAAVAYIGPERPAETFDGDTLYQNLCQQDTAKTFTNLSPGQPVSMLLPIILTDNCNQHYTPGTYTLNVRVCLPNETLRETLQIRIKENTACEPSQPEELVGVIADTVNETDAQHDKQKNTEPLAITNMTLPDTVTAGEPFTVDITATAPRPGEHVADIYGYANDGRNPITLGKNGDTWQNTWTAATETVLLQNTSTATITVKTEDGITGTYPFTAKARTPDHTAEQTGSLTVEQPKTLALTHEVSEHTVTLRPVTSCISCSLTVETPSKTVTRQDANTTIQLLREPGTYTALLLAADGAVTDNTTITVTETSETMSTDQGTVETTSPTGSFLSSTGIPDFVGGVVDFVTGIF